MPDYAMLTEVDMEITVGMFRKLLSGFDEDCVLYFGGLDFYRLKLRGDKLLQVEFDQTVYRDNKGLVVVENHD
jgi:hypothetical protein